MAVVEGQMTWLVYISGAIVGGYSWSDSGSAEGEEVIDAR
jgi:exportin-7